jgi:hypothetical protein
MMPVLAAVFEEIVAFEVVFAFEEIVAVAVMAVQ